MQASRTPWVGGLPAGWTRVRIPAPAGRRSAGTFGLVCQVAWGAGCRHRLRGRLPVRRVGARPGRRPAGCGEGAAVLAAAGRVLRGAPAAVAGRDPLPGATGRAEA